MSDTRSNDAQPLPVEAEGQVEVTPLARTWFNSQLTQQYNKGLSKYGLSLRSWNGRDVFRDIHEEAVDLVQYLTQAEIEYRDLVRRLADREAEIISYVETLRAVQSFILPRMAHIGEPAMRVMRDVVAAVSGAPNLPVLTELHRLRAENKEQAGRIDFLEWLRAGQPEQPSDTSDISL